MCVYSLLSVALTSHWWGREGRVFQHNLLNTLNEMLLVTVSLFEWLWFDDVSHL